MMRVLAVAGALLVVAQLHRAGGEGEVHHRLLLDVEGEIQRVRHALTIPNRLRERKPF